MDKYTQKGQVLLIVVLIMVVTLTVGLSLAARSIINLRNTNEEDNSQRAFFAAEAGIEQTIKQNSAPASGASLGNNSTIKQINVTAVSGTTLLPLNGAPIVKDDGTDIWLSTYKTMVKKYNS